MSKKDNKLLLTKEGHQKLLDELKHLEGDKKKEIAARLKKALSYGDLKENFEYQDAKEEQGLVENRISELKEMLKNVEIVKESSKKSDGTVQIGSKVTIRNLTDNDEPEVFSVVGTMEADPLKGFISNESPIGAAVLERKVGDKMVVKTPKGEMEYELVSVE